MKRFENYSSPPRHTSSWNVTGRVLVSANAFRILLTRAWNLSAFRSLLYFPSSRIIRKQGANLGVQTEIEFLSSSWPRPVYGARIDGVWGDRRGPRTGFLLHDAFHVHLEHVP